MIDFEFYGDPPWDHQRATFEKAIAADRPVYALHFEQRCGKTRVALDLARYYYGLGKIDALIVVAPNGVHRAWITDHVPAWFPPDLERDCLIWRQALTDRKWFQRVALDLLRSKKFVIFTINVEAVTTKRGRRYLENLLKKRRCAMIVDESTDIKTPSAKRTKAIIALGRRALYRWECTGTPVTKGPLNLYSQFRFLDPEILGFRSFYTFKHRYAEWEEGYNGQTGVTYETIARDDEGKPKFRNVKELQAKIAPYSSRVTRYDIRGTATSVFEKDYLELSKEQRRIYDKLREEYLLELAEGDVPVAHVLSRMTRLQQIACGVVPNDDLDGVEIIPGPHPRIEKLWSWLDNLEGRVLIWCRFRLDVDLITRSMRERGHAYLTECLNDDGSYETSAKHLFATYRGGDSQEVRAAAERLFSLRSTDERVRWLIGNPKAGGRGLDFSGADTVIFYSCPFGLETRLQCQDRVENLQKNIPNLLVDLIAEDTVDEKIVTTLREDREIADAITGDDPREWL